MYVEEYSREREWYRELLIIWENTIEKEREEGVFQVEERVRG